MNFLNLFSYIELALGVVTVASAIANMVASPAPVNGPALSFAVQPLLQALAALTHKTVPSDLVNELAQTIADVINTYYKKTAPTATLFPGGGIQGSTGASFNISSR